MTSNRRKLVDAGYEECVVFERPDYDTAIIGITDDNRVVYDMDLMVEHLVSTDSMSEIEAIEFIEYNTIRTLPYVEHAPIIIRRVENL